jgi:hypothetical protein
MSGTLQTLPLDLTWPQFCASVILRHSLYSGAAYPQATGGSQHCEVTPKFAQVSAPSNRNKLHVNSID